MVESLLAGMHVSGATSIKDIPAQWAKIRQGLDIFRISSNVCIYRIAKSKKI